MPNASLTRTNLRTPKAAAIAGMLFSLLTVAAFWLFWISVPADPRDAGSWLTENSKTVALGLNLIPFAGIAFLWFIGVLRDRLGELEDRFFCHGILRKWPFVLGHAVHGSDGGWRTPHGYRCPAARADQLSHAALRPRRRLQPREHLHGQDGRRIYDHHVYDGDLHQVCAALVSAFRLRALAPSPNRELLRPLEFYGFPAVGVYDQRFALGVPSSASGA
jgi:hypothetical protein